MDVNVHEKFENIFQAKVTGQREKSHKPLKGGDFIDTHLAGRSLS